MQITVLVIFKIALAPLLMIGLARAVELHGAVARAAVLLAILPISLASFSFAEEYNTGQQVLSNLIIWDTVLMLPAILVWLEILDGLDIFNV